MKKQFNRMRQLASQNLGRSVFSFPPALLQAVVMFPRCRFSHLSFVVPVGRAELRFWRNYLRSLSFRC